MVFIYTTVANIFERPEGIRIAGVLHRGIIVISLLSRIRRSFELHATHVHLDRQALEFMSSNLSGPIGIIAHEPLRLTAEAYRDKLTSAIEVSHLPVDYQALFLEVIVDDSSDFETELEVRGVVRHGYRILEVHGPVVPNTIASVLLHIRDVTGLMPHIYFRWTEGNPVVNLLRFLFLGEGEIAPSPVRCCGKPNRTSPGVRGSTSAKAGGNRRCFLVGGRSSGPEGPIRVPAANAGGEDPDVDHIAEVLAAGKEIA